MSKRQGAPKHQNSYAWKPNAGHKINETEVGGRLRPYSEITGVCHRCREQIDWKRRYGKYKPLVEPAKCQRCSKRTVRQAYHNLCPACAKEQKVCAKCRCCVDQIVGRDSAEIEVEQRALEEAIKNARERDRRTLIRTMNKGKPKSSAKAPTNDRNKVGELFPSASLEDYAAKSRHGSYNANNTSVDKEKEENGDDDETEEGEEDGDHDDSGDFGDDSESEAEDEDGNTNLDEVATQMELKDAVPKFQSTRLE